MTKQFIISMTFILMASTGIAQSSVESSSASLYPGLQYRNIGPFRGGRSVAATGVPNDPQTYYMGTVGGGIWKTSDAGISWLNISDGQLNTSSVGAIAVASSDVNVLYVGMGEHSIRGVMTAHGDGVYKSEDAGKTWKHVGLKEARHISEIIIHPKDHDIVYVAVQGAAYGDSEVRGIYKSIDGGKTWTQHLYIDKTTGVTDISIDASNPRILYASTWDHRRYPWYVRSGGPGSALYKSIDAGTTWIKIHKGLPAEMGKTSIDVSPANPSVVYANIESKGESGGVYRSDDGGQSWRQTTKDRVTVARAWYYIEIFADPKDENTVYVLNAPMLKSIDGGKSFKSIPNPHGDQHHLWINPSNPQNMILANDGGACISFNGGDSWSTQQNQPTIQFYRVITDRQFPYNVYGGQQDNSSLITASRTSSAGISWKDWYEGPGCECAFIAFDPDSPVDIYGGCYQGNISIMDSRSRTERDIMAYPVAGLAGIPANMKYRFNWNAPIVASPQNPKVIYHAANQVLKTEDGGMTWVEISGDLTRNDKAKQTKGGGPFTSEGAGGEIYNTISYLEVSPHSSSVLWAGSDCGLVHVTTDGGQNWSNVSPRDLGEVLINSIDVSPHDPATAYVVANAYKFNDFRPLIFKTTDFGKTWQKLITGIRDNDFVRVVREDEKKAGLLYAGTESGMYISHNGGRQWQEFQLNLPTTPINDITFADNDLVIATGGRSFWILDDLSAFQQDVDKLKNEVVIFTPKDAYRITGGGKPKAGSALGQNPHSGIVVDYYLPENMDSAKVTLEIWYQGALMRQYGNKKDDTFKSFMGGPSAPEIIPTKKGVNRFAWDMRKSTFPGVENVFLLGSYQGISCPPGEYRVKLIVGNRTVETKATIKPDPRVLASQDAYIEQYVTLTQLEKMINTVQNSVNEIGAAKEQLIFYKSNEAMPDTIRNVADKILGKVKSWEATIIQRDTKTFQDVINFENKINAEIVNLISRIDAPIPVITNGMKIRLKEITEEFNKVMAQKSEIINDDFASFNSLYNSIRPNAVSIHPK